MQVVEQIQTAAFVYLLFKIEKSTDISLCAELMVFAKYVIWIYYLALFLSSQMIIRVSNDQDDEKGSINL